MARPCPENQNFACYSVTKHSWKGKYKRLFSIGTLEITTFDPYSLAVTNKWLHEDIIAFTRNDTKQDEYKITVQNRAEKYDMHFSSDYTTDILTHCLQFSTKFADKNFDPLNLPRLSTAAAQCIGAMTVDPLLRIELFRNGVFWQLVPHLFHYDYTLDEGGVQHSEDSNKQSLG